MENQIRKRNENIDVIKGLCAYLVIVLHCGSPFWSAYIDAVSRVAVPLLFMISGYFCKGKWGEIKRKIYHLLKIFLAGESVFLLYYLWKEGAEWWSWLGDNVYVEHIFRVIIYNDTKIFMAGWFLLSLVYAYVIFALLAKWDRKYVYVWIPILILWQWGWQRAAMLFRIDLNFLDIKVLRAIPFFLLGSWFRERELDVKKIASQKKIFGCIVAGVVLCFFERFLIEQLVFKPALSIYLGNVVLLIGCFAWAVSMPEIKWLKGFAYVGRNLSLYIYVLHMVFLGLMTEQLGAWSVIGVIVISTVVSYLLYEWKQICYKILKK